MASGNLLPMCGHQIGIPGPFCPRKHTGRSRRRAIFKTDSVSFLYVTRPTGYISTPSQTPLACPTYTTLIPLWAVSDHAPRQRHLQPSPAPQEAHFRSIPACGPSWTDQPRTIQGWSAPASSHKVPGSSTYSRLQTGAHVGLARLHHSQSCELPVSLKHRLSYPTTTTTTYRLPLAVFFGSRTTAPALLQTA